MPKINTSPCWDVVNNHDCPKRHIGCHSTCGDYAAYTAERAAKQAAALKAADIRDYTTKAMRRKARRHTNNWGGQNKTN